jgi:hypothetical protein
MGVPLEACKKDWFVMEKGHRDEFATALKRYAAKFGLHEITFGSFTRDCGYELAAGATAGDMVHALMAIIESPNALSASYGLGQDRLELVRHNFSVGLQALDHQYANNLNTNS